MGCSENVVPTASSGWIAFADEQFGLRAELPTRPLCMQFEVPFNNDTTIGRLHLFSAPFSEGVAVIAVLDSPHQQSLVESEINFLSFFEKVLVPALFYDAHLLSRESAPSYSFKADGGTRTATFSCSYQRQGVEQLLQGRLSQGEKRLVCALVLLPKQKVTPSTCEKFLNSVTCDAL